MNIVNVNLFDSSALIDFLNNLSAGNANVNLDSAAFDSNGSVTSLTDSATNTASIGNNETVQATTGSNSADGGNSTISTGNAYAAGNAATLANATLVDSHYVMLVMNTFGPWAGSLILPGPSFWDSFLNMASAVGAGNLGTSDSTAATANNAATVSTNATTSADTGNNVASSTDSGATVQTGSAQSAATSINDVNQTHIGGAAVDIIFHIFGNWSGQALNLPPGFTAVQTPDGLEITASNASQSAINQGQLALSADNNASIQNNLDVSASTGGNNASGSGANISTGNAYASANSITAANVTSISHNWLAAIFNVYGDWSGNVSFGAPDLWVGIRADLPDGAAAPGNRIIYHYTVKNNGDVAAHNVRLSRTIGSNLIHPDPANPSGVWNLGTLGPGEVRNIDETVTIDESALAVGQESVSDQATVSEDETDADSADNSDVISMIVGPTMIGGGDGTPGAMPNFSIDMTSDASSTIAASSTVDYTIHLFNNGGFASHAVVTDQTTDPSGNVINSQNWDLGTVNSQEDITLGFTALFGASSTPGVYVNTAQVIPADNQQYFTSAIASTSITIGDPNASSSVEIPSPGVSLGIVNDLPPVAASDSDSSSKFLTDATSTVRRNLSLGFMDGNAPLPPDAGGPIKSGADNGQLAAVGDTSSNPFAWSLYLAVLAAGAWYLVYKRKSFGWGIVEQEK